MSLEPRSIPDKSKEELYLSRDQWNRIGNQIGMKTKVSNAVKAQVADRIALKEASKHMTENWKNTNAGLYKERLQSRKIKAYNEEVQRVHNDILEEKYQETRRKYVLDQSKKRLYFQTDRVKKLHAAKALAEALKEREEQMKFKGNAAKAIANYEVEFAKSTLRDVDKYKDELQLRSKHDKHKHKEIAAFLKEQDAVVKEKLVKEKEDDYRLGKVILEEDRRHEREAEEVKIKIQLRKCDYKKSLDTELKLKRQIEDCLNKMEEADIKRAQLFEEAKRKMVKLHKEKLKEFARRKEKLQEILRKGMTDEVGQLRLKEQRIYQKAVEEKLKMEEEITREKVDEHAKNLQNLQDFYQMRVRKAAAERDTLKRQNFYEGRQYQEEAEKFTNEQKEAVLKRYVHGKKAQDVQLRQMERKKRQESHEFQNKLEECLSHMKGLRDEEEMFQKYAKHLIAECEKQGLNTFALRKAAEPGIECGRGPLYSERGGVRPKYLAATDAADDLETKRMFTKKKSNVKARLGFGN